ncbi:RING finger protein 17-like, partial [Diretmus argenteus]
TLVTGLATQAKREQARLVTEIDKAVDQAIQTLYMRREALLRELPKMQARFSSSHEEVSRVQERMNVLKMAIQTAKEFRHAPSLEQYDTLEKVLDTLQAPVDAQSFDMNCITLGCGLSCVCQTDSLMEGLKMKASSPEPLSEEPPLRALQQGGSNRKPAWCRGEGRSRSHTPPSRHKPPQQQDQESLRANRPSQCSSRSPGHQPGSTLTPLSPASDPGSPDVIIESVIEVEHQPGSTLSPLRPASDPGSPDVIIGSVIEVEQQQVYHLVLVTHVVNPSHFYIRYVAEKREGLMLTKKINHLCSGDKGRFTPSDTLETGSAIFVKWKDGFWCRATVVELWQSGSVAAVNACPITRLARVQVFLLDYGFTKAIALQSWKKRKALQEAQKRLNLPEHELITECQTRWGSRMLMIDRILEQQKALAEVLSGDRNTRHLVLNYQDLDVLESVSKALGPLLEFTDALSGEEYVSVSFLKPVLSLFNTDLLAPKEGDTDLTKSLKKKTLEYLNSKYEDADTQELLDVASFLDPRYKTQYISEDNIPIIKARLVSEIKTMELKIKGWSKEAQVEFRNVVGSAAMEMQVFGQDKNSLQVDLRKSPMDRASELPISVREFLVFIEVARFYSPVVFGRSPLPYYAPVYPDINTEFNAVVSYISSPADFYIQLVDSVDFQMLTAKLQACYNATTVDRDTDLHLYCPVMGQACVACFDDNVWYRAQVIGHPGGRKVEVRYVDIGNTKILSVHDLRKLKDEFFALPAKAIQCCLADVVPLDGETWSDTCTDRFISLAHQKLVTVVAFGKISFSKMEPNSRLLPVKLFEGSLDGPLANISDQLVTEELASFKNGLSARHAEDPDVWDSPIEDLLAAEGKSCLDSDTSDRDQEPLEFQPQLQLPVCLNELKVRVTHVSSPGSFCVQLTQNDSQLKRVSELLNQEYASMEPQEVEWKADMYCAALINGVWERGQICTTVTSSSIAEVLRCDFGNKVKLHVSNLHPLQPSLVGSLMLECTLYDIRPAGGQSTWTATACDFISYYLDGASAVMTVKEMTDERPVPVTLFCSNRMGSYVNMADSLVSEGLALKQWKPRNAVVPKPEECVAEPQVSGEQKDGPDMEKRDTPPSPPACPVLIPPPSSPTSIPAPSSAFPKPAPRTHLSAAKVRTQLYHPPELPGHGHIQMTISGIGEDGLIYARKHRAECQLEKLKEHIQQRMKTLPKQKPFTWKSVLGCAVIGPDMVWYRGQLLEVQRGEVKVRYVDYGLVENIPVVHVYPLLLCEDVPQLCVPCQLYGVNPVGGQWQWDAVALLKALLLNRCVDVQVMELPTDPRGSLTVQISMDGMNLSRILCHHQHATMDKHAERPIMIPPAPLLDDWEISTEGLESPEVPVLGPFIYPVLPQEGEHFSVRIKHLRTPNELFLWPVEGGAEVDEETLEEALDRINTDAGSLPQLSNFLPGSACLAKYSDGKYYRATLMDFVSVDPVRLLIQHVDFGSDDTLPPSKLRQMPAELLRFSTRALKVRVAGFKAPSVSLETDMLPYQPKWSKKAVQEMIGLLHGNITASVVATEPALTVLLYDKKGELVHLPLVSSGLADLD